MKKIISVFFIAFLLTVNSVFAAPQKAKQSISKSYLSIAFGSANTSDWEFDASSGRRGIADVAVDSGFDFAFAFGLDGGDYRAEVETSIQSIGLKSSTVRVGRFGKIKRELSGASLVMTSVMGNFYYNFNPKGTINPFILGGVGFGIGSLKSFKWGTEEFLNNPVWLSLSGQVGIGLSLNITENFALDTSYRYLNTTDGSFRCTNGIDSYEAKVKNKGINNFLVGFRFSF